MIELKHKRVLIVDDEEVVRDLCVRVLTSSGYTVETAIDGHQAMTRFKEQTYDLLITDLRMPGEMNGLALGQAVKRVSPETRIILMTAFPDVDTAVGTLRIGAMDYLIKPFDRNELIHCAAKCLDPIVL